MHESGKAPAAEAAEDAEKESLVFRAGTVPAVLAASGCAPRPRRPLRRIL